MKRFLACLFVLGLLLAGCKPVSDTGDGPIKIGFVGPLTGEAASYGLDSVNGSKLKIKEINAAGGINGRMVELIAEDGRCNGSDAASAAQKLINVDKVVAVLGGQCSGETLAIAPIAEAAKIVIMSAISSSPDVTKAGEFVFRDYPSDALKTKAMAKYFKEKGYKNVAMISENTDFCQGFRTSLKEDFGELVFDEVVEPNTKDYRTLMTRLKDMEVDVFVTNGQFPASIVAMLEQMREQGIEVVAISHDVGQTDEVVKLAKDAAEGFQAINIPLMSETSEFGAKYMAEYTTPPQGAMAYAAHGYDAAGVVLQAIAKVGTDGTAIRDYLNSLTSYPGAIGNFSFDDNGDVTGVNYKLFEVKDGKWTEIADAPAM